MKFNTKFTGEIVKTTANYISNKDQYIENKTPEFISRLEQRMISRRIPVKPRILAAFARDVLKSDERNDRIVFDSNQATVTSINGKGVQVTILGVSIDFPEIKSIEEFKQKLRADMLSTPEFFDPHLTVLDQFLVKGWLSPKNDLFVKVAFEILKIQQHNNPAEVQTPYGRLTVNETWSGVDIKLDGRKVWFPEEFNTVDNLKKEIRHDIERSRADYDNHITNDMEELLVRGWKIEDIFIDAAPRKNVFGPLLVDILKAEVVDGSIKFPVKDRDNITIEITQSDGGVNVVFGYKKTRLSKEICSIDDLKAKLRSDVTLHSDFYNKYFLDDLTRLKAMGWKEKDLMVHEISDENIVSETPAGGNTLSTVLVLVNGNGDTYYFKPLKMGTEERNNIGPATHMSGINVDQPKFGNRAFFVYNLSQVLNFRVIPETGFTTHNAVPGYVIKKSLGEPAYLTKPGKNPVILREAIKLHLLDALCGQADRHAGNYFIDVEGNGVYGIDNDQCGGYLVEHPNYLLHTGNRHDKIDPNFRAHMENNHKDVTEGKLKFYTKGTHGMFLPPVMDTEMVAAIDNISPKWLSEFMTLHGFNETEISAGLKRLKAIQDHVQILKHREQRPEELRQRRIALNQQVEAIKPKKQALDVQKQLLAMERQALEAKKMALDKKKYRKEVQEHKDLLLKFSDLNWKESATAEEENALKAQEYLLTNKEQALVADEKQPILVSIIQPNEWDNLSTMERLFPSTNPESILRNMEIKNTYISRDELYVN